MTTKTDETCVWHAHENDYGIWTTDCHNMFALYDGTPAENQMAFCCFCGKHLVTDDAMLTERNKLLDERNKS